MDLSPLSAKGLVKFIRLRIIILVGLCVVSLLPIQLIGTKQAYAAGNFNSSRLDTETPVPWGNVNPQTGSQRNEADALDAGVAYFITLLAGLLHIIATALGNFALWIIELLVIPVLQYNNFSDSTVIGNGWSLVRDVVNMFVVLILIVIAVSTIVGYEKAHWQKSLPQFLLAVVMVNFSRTICGLLIDVSQVIMFTFVNALLDVVAGNFAKMLGIDSFGAYSNSIITEDSASLKVIEASGQLGAAFLELVLYVVIAIVLLLLMLAFIWRIVVLWVLVVMSPLTFFATGIGGLFKFTDSIGGEWWKKFTAALTLGPMLTFFLWLSLTTATTGITEGFNVKDIKTDPPRLLESFDNSRLLATFLGIAILIIGVEQSAASAGSLGGLAKKYLGDPKLGEKLVGGVAGGAATVLGGRAIKTSAQRNLAIGADNVGSAGMSAVQKIASGLASTGTLGALAGGVIGRAGVNVFGSLQQKGQKFEKARQEEAAKRVGNYTDDQLIAHANLEAAGVRAPLSWAHSDDRNQFRKFLATDEKKRGVILKSIGETKTEDMLRDLVNMSDAELKAIGIDPGSMSDVKSENLHLLSRANRQKFLESGKLNVSKISERAFLGQSPEVSETIDDLGNAIVKSKDGKNVSLLDQMKEGEHGPKLLKLANAAGQPELYDSKQAKERKEKGDSAIELGSTMPDGGDYSPDAYAARILNGKINLANVDLDQLAQSQNLVAGILQANYQGRALTAWRNDPEDASRAQLFFAIADQMALDSDKQLPLFNARVDQIRMTASPDARKAEINKLARQFFVETDEDGNESVNTVRLQAALQKRPDFLSDFAGLASAEGFGTQAGEAMLKAFNAGDIRQMGIAYSNALISTDREPMKANFEVLASLMQSQIDNGAEISGNMKKAYDAMVRTAGVMNATAPDLKGTSRSRRAKSSSDRSNDGTEDDEEEEEGN
jgi:hypothetical protein